LPEPRSILIVKLGAVGDCIHTLVAAHAIRRAWPGITLGWIVEGKSKEVVLGHPDLDHVHVWNRRQSAANLRAGRPWQAWAETRRVIEEMREVGYEVAVDFQNLFKSGFFAWQSAARRRLSYERLREGNFLFMNDWQRVSRGGHMVARYLKLLEPLGLSVEDRPPAVPIFVPEDKKKAADDFFAQRVPPAAKVVAINPAASLPIKFWPAERYAEAADRLARELGLLPMIIWGPGEEALADRVLRNMKTPGMLAPPTTLKELAHLLSRCAMYVGNDSGPMHLAAAMGIAVVGLFGPSDPRRVGPWTARASAVEPPRPFSKTRRMEEIAVEQVVRAAAELSESR